MSHKCAARPPPWRARSALRCLASAPALGALLRLRALCNRSDQTAVSEIRAHQPRVLPKSRMGPSFCRPPSAPPSAPPGPTLTLNEFD